MPSMSDKDKFIVHPASKLGEYTVIKDIAEGTFGKVKSQWQVTFRCKADLLTPLHSGHTHCYWPQSRYEVHFESRYPNDEDENQSPTRS